MEEKIQKLKYRLIDSSSEDSENRLYELIRGADSFGWVSARFCSYPQEILLQFMSPVNLKQIHILSHEKKITSMIEIYCYYPAPNENTANYKTLSFEKLGYIRMDTNSKTNYKAREFRKIYVDTHCYYLKLLLHKNFVNKYNVFNQVGLISIDFYGHPTSRSDLIIKESLLDNHADEDEIDEIAHEKLKILKNQQEDALRIEDYDEAKKLKKSIDRVKIIGRKIFELDFQKRAFINNEDFDNAKIMKLEIERLKSNLKYLDRQLSTVQAGSKDFLPNEENKENSKDITNKEHEINEDIVFKEKSFTDIREKEHRDKESSFSINTEINYGEKSMMLNKSNKFLEKIDEEFMSYDDQILPAIKKKLNLTNVSQIIEEFKDEALLKGELEDIEPNILSTYEIFIKFIGEEGLKKIFSKNILWKDEGLDNFNSTIPKMFSDATPTEINTIINLTMKMVFTFLCERHPQACIRSIEIFQNLLNGIKKSSSNLNYDFTITDHILIKIKEKVGDVNPKIRTRAVDLYCFMLKQEFCDYNNLLSELVEEELKHIDSKKVVKSSKMILGKLSIFKHVFEDYSQALLDKRTDANSFPFFLVATYVIENINHSKSEVRKLDRDVIIKMYQTFGFKKLEPLLKKVELKELEKLLKSIPELKDIIDAKGKDSLIIIPSKSPRNRSTSRDRKGSKEKTDKNKKKKSSSPPNLPCSSCGKKLGLKTEEDIKNHIEKECVLFMNCGKCSINLEIKNYMTHILNECVKKAEFKVCKRCKEGVDVKDYDEHVKDNKCNPAKNPNSSNRCPLCHKDIPPHDKGFLQHLVKDICQKNKRRDKISFVNGK